MTAVEWLYNHLFPKQLDGFSDEEWSKIDLSFKQAKEMEKEKDEHYNNMLSMLQETYRRLEHTDMISLRKQIKEVLTFKSE